MKKIVLSDGVNYSYIPTDRFKTVLMSVSFYMPLDKNAGLYALALEMMKSGTLKEPDVLSFNRRLYDLYGATVDTSEEKFGDYQKLRLTLSFLDDRFAIGNETVSAQASQLLCDMVFGRYLDGSTYPSDAIEREKRLLKEYILAEFNDKRKYARTKCEQIICQDEPFGFSPLGRAEDIDGISAVDIKKAVADIIEKSFMVIQVTGSREPEGFSDSIRDLINRIDRRYTAYSDNITKSAGILKTVSEKLPVNQGKLVMGFRANEGGSDASTVPMMVMADVFGGGPYSLLFANVREKQSLCYYCSARPVRQKGIIFVESGVEQNNIVKTQESVLQQFETVQSGKFEKETLNSSKRALCNAAKSVASDIYALDKYYSSRAMEAEIVTPEQLEQLIMKVSAENIAELANKFKLDTVFTVEAIGENGNA